MDKRMFGWFEAVFDALYLCAALGTGLYVLSRASQPAQVLSGVMALVLFSGDAFHLVPRIAAVATGARRRLFKALGFGKLAASLTMTVFYVLLWHTGLLLFAPAAAPAWTILVYALAILRIALCLAPQNRWFDEAAPPDWAVYRNVPFLLLGLFVTVLFAAHAQAIPGLRWVFLSIALSFAFYMPVVLFAGRNKKLGMLMLPKSCAYLYILFSLAVSLV